MKRRSFLKALGGAAGALVLGLKPEEPDALADFRTLHYSGPDTFKGQDYHYILFDEPDDGDSCGHEWVHHQYAKTIEISDEAISFDFDRHLKEHQGRLIRANRVGKTQETMRALGRAVRETIERDTQNHLNNRP